ncbi:uncharacterized protein LOC106668113 [Cimex lectularius]|uniref:THAP-type domain-containing protein n=1 Tax=Cimex lectularius TaxID=79782 RepID=A0A8I6RXM0_CIMLE|nr:uncharacterized protein LOC106668113 [Cimex lectularius]
MPGSWCAIGTCGNSSYRAKKLGRTDLSFHTFPRDPELRAVWVSRCNRFTGWNPKSSYVCSDHFKPTDFRRNLRAELMGYKERQRKLHPNVVPSINLGFSYDNREMYSDSEGCIAPLDLPHNVPKKKKKKRMNEVVVIEKRVLQRTIETVQKLNDECLLFGEMIAHEYRSISSEHLRKKLIADIQEVVHKIAEEDENNVYPDNVN